MSDNRTERPTPRRLEQARRKGMLALSPELGVALSFGGVLVVTALLLPRAMGRMAHQASALFAHGPVDDSSLLVGAAEDCLLLVAALVAPLVGAAAIGALVAGFSQSRGLVLRTPAGAWSGDAFRQRLARMLPTQSSLRRLTMAALKLLLLGGVTCLTLWGAHPSLLGLSSAGPWQLLGLGQGLGLKLAARLTLVLLLIAAADLVRARWAHLRRLRMSKRELREEWRLDEGDPRLKSRRRERARELLGLSGPDRARSAREP
jgi:flagellar biosynthesis protein FlhB